MPAKTIVTPAPIAIQVPRLIDDTSASFVVASTKEYDPTAPYGCPA